MEAFFDDLDDDLLEGEFENMNPMPAYKGP